MAGELAYDPATGQLVYSPATGQLAIGCDGGGGGIEYGDDCTHCEAGKTPKYWTVTLSGVQPCLACIQTGAYSSFKTTGLTINGTFLLTQYAPCAWGCTGGSFTAERYSDTTCGTKTNDISGSLRISLIRQADRWDFRITGDFFDEPFFVFFEGSSSEASDDDCLNIAAMSNTAGGTVFPKAVA